MVYLKRKLTTFKQLTTLRHAPNPRLNSLRSDKRPFLPSNPPFPLHSALVPSLAVGVNSTHALAFHARAFVPFAALFFPRVTRSISQAVPVVFSPSRPCNRASGPSRAFKFAFSLPLTRVGSLLMTPPLRSG